MFFQPKTTLADRKKFINSIKKTKNISRKIDKQNNLANTYKAKITPTIFVYDSAKTLIYEGSIDNKYISIGNYRQKTTAFYLRDAIDYLQHKILELPIKKTDAVGCFIE